MEKGWRRIGEGLEEDWKRAGEGLGGIARPEDWIKSPDWRRIGDEG